MSLSMADFPSLDDDTPAVDGLTQLGSSQLSPATTAKISEAAEKKAKAKARGKKAAETRRLNKLKKQQEAQGEVDPSGKDAHTAGAKLDGGKIDVAMILASFPRALFAVGSVGKFGAEKYSYEGWLEVDNAIHRYSSAGLRHFLKQFIEGPIDSDSKMHHLAHEAWNALAKLELYCRDNAISGEFNVNS